MNLYNAGKRYEVMTSHIFFEVKKKSKYSSFCSSFLRNGSLLTLQRCLGFS